MPECLICKSSYDPFVSFGKMPIANGFLTAEQFDSEYFFEMKVGFCSNCKMVQLVEQPDRKMMFHQNYAFFSSTSMLMEAHFKKFAESVREDFLSGSNAFVVEIGSNDGIMLQNFTKAGIKHLGIEPSANVAEESRKKGIKTISDFFDETLAKTIVKDYGQADTILSANAMCHLPYLHSVAAGIKVLLKPAGVFMFEDPYLGDIIEKTSYDQIYDEHAFYFSMASVSHLFRQYDMELIDAIHQDVHGGSMRYLIAHKGMKEVSPEVVRLSQNENRIGLHSLETFYQLRKNIEASRNQLMKLLTTIKNQGKRVVGYAATSKSTTVTNYCGITPELVEFISDTTPIKQGKFSPGTHIPVCPHEKFSSNYPDFALLFGWNHAKEIMAKETAFKESGGKWIVYVPNVETV